MKVTIIVTMNKYFDLWVILWGWKRKGAFSTSEFEFFFPSAHPRKVLFDLFKLGFIKKIERDQYIVVSPTELTTKDYAKSIIEGYLLLRNTGLKYALTNVDAITKWTKGAYNADRFFGVYPIHIKIKQEDLSKWKKFFKKVGKKCLISGERIRGTMFGVFYVLYPEKDFEAEIIEDEQVIPLKETVKFAEENIATYEHALEIINKLYNLGLKVKYEIYAK